jgi:hypothetical protein
MLNSLACDPASFLSTNLCTRLPVDPPLTVRAKLLRGIRDSKGTCVWRSTGSYGRHVSVGTTRMYEYKYLLVLLRTSTPCRENFNISHSDLVPVTIYSILSCLTMKINGKYYYEWLLYFLIIQYCSHNH